MDKPQITADLTAIVARYVPADTLKSDVPLTAEPYFISSRDMTAIFLDIERIFEVDLNTLFDMPMGFSVNSIAEAICALQ